MRNVILSLSAVVFLSVVACNSKDSEKTVRSMSATIKRNSADSPVTWNADAAKVEAKIPFKGSVRFLGSQYISNPTSMDMFVNNYKGKGIYKLYQGSAVQTDSNSVKLTYIGRDFASITGSVEIIEDNAEYYIGRFEFIGSNLDDTITIKNGSFTIAK
jgi:hypothetical protein